MPTLHQLSDHLYRFEDTCNAYLVKDGDAGLLIDAGCGAVLDHLTDIGIKSIEWVLHTHHHRDQCWGDQRLIGHGAKIAAPAHERHLFEQAEVFWQTRRTFDNYDDRNNFFTIGRNIPVDFVLEDYEEFQWHNYSFFVLPAKGHTPGSSTLIVEIDGRCIAFTGDLIAKGGKLYQLHAMEYTYGDMVGAIFTMQSIQALRSCLTGRLIANRTFNASQPMLLPSHGEPIDEPIADIDQLEETITELATMHCGLRVGGRDTVPESNFVPKANWVPLSKHLLWSGTWTCCCFYVLLSDSGKAMFIDYGHYISPHMGIGSDHGGLESMRFIEHHIEELRDRYDVTDIDLVVPTHIHDDHTLGIPHLQRHYGTKCYALHEVAQVLTDPAGWASTPCTYREPIRIDRTLHDGEQFKWEEFTFDVYFAPGQTEFHSVLASEIDGRKVAFTGDNLFYERMAMGAKIEMRPFQTTVLRNSFQLDMHRRCIDVMRKINPELICPGHRETYPCDKTVLDHYSDFIHRKERVFRKLVAEPADHYIDLFWARLRPYLATANPGDKIEYTLMLRNNLDRKTTYEARLLAPDHWKVKDEFDSITLDATEQGTLTLTAIAPSPPDNIRKLMTAEIAIDGVTQGPVAEALVTVCN